MFLYWSGSGWEHIHSCFILKAGNTLKKKKSKQELLEKEKKKSNHLCARTASYWSLCIHCLCPGRDAKYQVCEVDGHQHSLHCSTSQDCWMRSFYPEQKGTVKCVNAEHGKLEAKSVTPVSFQHHLSVHKESLTGSTSPVTGCHPAGWMCCLSAVVLAAPFSWFQNGFVVSHTATLTA